MSGQKNILKLKYSYKTSKKTVIEQNVQKIQVDKNSIVT